MVMRKLSVTLITGRSFGQGIGKEYGKFSEKYMYVVGSCEMNRRDMETLGVSVGRFVRVKSSFGDTTVRVAESSQDLPQGTVFMPYGPTGKHCR